MTYENALLSQTMCYSFLTNIALGYQNYQRPFPPVRKSIYLTRKNFVTFRPEEWGAALGGG